MSNTRREDFDLALGARGLYTVRRRVEWVERQSVLPPPLFERFAGTCSGGCRRRNILRRAGYTRWRVNFSGLVQRVSAARGP